MVTDPLVWSLPLGEPTYDVVVVWHALLGVPHLPAAVGRCAAAVAASRGRGQRCAAIAAALLLATRLLATRLLATRLLATRLLATRLQGMACKPCHCRAQAMRPPPSSSARSVRRP